MQTYAAEVGELPFPVMKEAMLKLSQALRGTVTEILLKRATQEGTELVYFDDFLGNDDKDIFGKIFNVDVNTLS